MAYDAIARWVHHRERVLDVSSDFVFSSPGLVDEDPVNPGRRPSNATAAGLVDIKPHDFRRFVGTQLAKKDIPIAQKQLGHKRIETTVQNYVLDDVALGNVDDLLVDD